MLTSSELHNISARTWSLDLREIGVS